MATDQRQILLNAIKCTQELRASVSKVFETLTDGLKKPDEDENSQKTFLANVQQGLLAVNNDMSELEKLRNSVTPTGTPPTLGNSSMLSLDPTLDRTPLYAELIQSYRRTNKMHEYSSVALQLLHQNPLKRSHTSPVPTSKRPKRQPTTCHAISPQAVENVIQGCTRMYNDMPITLTRPMGSPALLQLTLGRTMKAVVVLRGLIIEWVLVKGYNEDFMTDDDQIDIWTPSRYAVFRKITDHTSAAMIHFYHPALPEIAVKSFLKWFHSYTTLFSIPCHWCHKFLQDKLPPTWRDVRTLEAYHENCRPKMYNM